MGKEFKVMRKKHSRRAGGPAVGQVIAVLLVVGVLFAAGWFLYEPAYNWIMNLAQTEEPEPAPPESSAAEPAPEQPQQPEPVPENWSEELRAVWIPASAAANSTMLESYLATLPADPVDTVVLELKNARGRVLYQSSVEAVGLAGAQNEGAFDLAAATQLLHQKGYTVLAKLHAFEDSTATAVLEEGKVFYAGTGFGWLDNSASAGGKAWLNPYAQQAQDYIAELAAEALSLGVDGIVLDGVQFPTGYSLELADYGDTKGLSRPQVLSGFVSRIEELVERHEGVGCWLYMDAAELYAPEEMGELGPYGGQARQVVKDHNLMVNVMPSQFGIGEETALTLPANPLQNPGETVSAVLRGLDLPQDSAMVMPVLQAYTAADIAMEFNLAYGEEEIAQQVDAALDWGARHVVLYDPSGAYTALK
ncbi:MAG: hypothetical protein J6B40_06335 [Oscillospiraceae bacterium]|nr:hypothetical protein [Oscillospiraceae bacterium]